MDARQLNETAKAMVAGDKGLLAMDESTPTAISASPRSAFPKTKRLVAPIAT